MCVLVCVLDGGDSMLQVWHTLGEPWSQLFPQHSTTLGSRVRSPGNRLMCPAPQIWQPVWRPWAEATTVQQAVSAHSVGAALGG